MGVQPLGGLRRPLMAADGLGSRARVLVMQRERGCRGVLAPLERARDREMRLAAARRAERGIGCITDPAMAEVVRTGPLRADDPTAPQFIESPHEPLLLETRGRGQPVG